MKLSKKTLLIAGLVVLLLAAAGAGVYMMWRCGSGEESGHGVEEFESGPGVDVEYYAMDGCPHCAAFDPVWKAVETKVAASGPDGGVSMHRWDIKTDEGHAKAKEAGVTAFPHVQKKGPDGTVEVFNGKRTEEELLNFCKVS